MYRPDGGSAAARVRRRGRTIETARGATGDARPMGERSDAAGPPATTRARTGRTSRPSCPAAAAAAPQAAADAAGLSTRPAIGTRRRRGPGDPVSAPGARARRPPPAPAAAGPVCCSQLAARPAVRRLRRRGRARLGLRATRPVHGRLRAQRRRGAPPPSRASRYARGRRSRFRPAWLLFALSSAMARSATASGAGTRWCCDAPGAAARPAPTSASCCFAPPAIVGLLVLAKRPVTRAGWVCLALDSWLIGGSLLTLSWSLALAHTARFDGPERRPHRAVAGLSAAGHRAGQHGARAALPALARPTARR